MPKEDWDKINELFHQALASPAAGREQFLRANCADANLRREVQSMLDAREEDIDFLGESVYQKTLEFIGKPPDYSGERIGAYQIIGEIGRGGMGAVYQAIRADGAYERRVAIKLLPRSAISEQLTTRFHRERQILANLAHPFIARLFDGGETENGTPYFVMELVRGSSIVDFCREKNTSIEERLRLFLKVCQAVQYAHEQGVVHRDLKPSNILVDEKGEPKLLDFGIAKFLSNDTTSDTTTGFSFLTPEYASPEQVSGRKITAQTDVYNLGIILYELVTEARPYDFENRSPAGIANVICESEPVPPSAATKRRNAQTQRENTNPQSAIRNLQSKDLDCIVLKALRKDAARRYASVKEFADDIQRFLDGLPVKAAPDALVYRARKFAARRRAFSAALAAGFLVALLAPLTYWEFFQNSIAVNSTRKDAARRLTFSAGADDYPRFAPDNRIVFTRTIEAEEKLFVINADGSGERLLNENLHADRIAFAPGGASVAFRSTDDYRIYAADSDFSNQRKLTRGRAGRPAWFPDASRLLFSYNFSEDIEKPTQPMYRDRDNVEIFTVGADGTNETNLTKFPAFDSDACASPDGKQIAFASDRDGAYEIYLMNADGSNVRRLTHNEFEDVKPAFSPDGTRIAFTSARDGNEEIYVMNADGTNPRRVTNALGDDREPQFSPDGKYIVFAADGEGNRQLYIIDAPPAE